MSLLFLIPARGGSKGIPGKNLRLLGGIPLIAHSIRCAAQAALMLQPRPVRIVCSTDDPTIAEAAIAWGAEVPFLRPATLAQDATPMIDAVLFTLETLEQAGSRFDAVVLLQPTSPLRSVDSLLAALRQFDSTPGASVVSAQEGHPLSWSYRLGSEDRLDALDLQPIATARQQAPRIAQLNGAIYIATPEHLRQQRAFLAPGKSRGYLMPAAESIDIDRLEDLHLSDRLLAQAATVVTLGRHQIGPGHPCFVIAEAGVNHNGDMQLAHQLVDAAADAGADCVKFQTFVAEKLVTADAAKAEYQLKFTDQAESQMKMLEKLTLPYAAHRELMDHAAQRGILFLSSPFDEDSVDFLESLNVAAFKIPSGEVINHPYLAHIAGKGKPVLMSSGMCTLLELDQAVRVLRRYGNPPLALFHCVTNYPTPAEEVNLRAMHTLQQLFPCPIGWSDHTEGLEVPIAAVAMGATMLEKHLTLDRTLPGPDQAASMEPAAFRAMMQAIRKVEVARGDGRKVPQASEIRIAKIARKSLCWKQDLPAGTIIALEHLVALRPGTGIAPSAMATVVGRRLRAAVQKGRLVAAADLD